MQASPMYQGSGVMQDALEVCLQWQTDCNHPIPKSRCPNQKTPACHAMHQPPAMTVVVTFAEKNIGIKTIGH